MTVTCVLSPRSGHVQLVIRDEEKEENLVEEKITVMKNEIQIFDVEDDSPDKKV